MQKKWVAVPDTACHRGGFFFLLIAPSYTVNPPSNIRSFHNEIIPSGRRWPIILSSIKRHMAISRSGRKECSAGMCGLPDRDAELQGFAPHGIADQLLTLGLKKPASFFFLACMLSSTSLSQTLRVSPYVGIIRGLAYALHATYNAIIINVGHDTKMQAIALMPAFIGSLLLIYEKRYWWGVALLALFTDLFVGANHPQIAYYSLIIFAFMTAAYIIRWIKEKDARHMMIAGGLTLFGGLTGVLCNAVVTFTTIPIMQRHLSAEAVNWPMGPVR